MEKKTKKRQRVKKITKVIMPILAIIVVLTATILPTYARSIADNSASVSYDGSTYILANNDMYITFYGTNDLSDRDKTVYVSKYLTSGQIDLDRDGYYFATRAPLSDRYESKNQYFDEFGTLVTDASTVGRPIYATFETGSHVALPWFNGIDEDVASFDYLDPCYLYSSYMPTAVNLHIDEFYLPSLIFYGGTPIKYGGVIMEYVNSSLYLEDAPYYFSCDVLTSQGNARHISTTGYITRTSNANGRCYDIPLIPYEVAQLLEAFNPEHLDTVRITNLNLNVTLSNADSIPTSSADPSFSYTTRNTIIAGDNGDSKKVVQGNMMWYEARFDNYHIVSDAFIAQSYWNGGAGGYQQGWDEGYDYGKAEGKVEGYIEGQQNPTQEIRDQIFNEGFDSALEGFNFTDWLGVAVGGFLDFTLFGNVTIGGILGVCIAMALVILFLKFFAGG